MAGQFERQINFKTLCVTIDVFYNDEMLLSIRKNVLRCGDFYVSIRTDAENRDATNTNILCVFQKIVKCKHLFSTYQFTMLQ